MATTMNQDPNQDPNKVSVQGVNQQPSSVTNTNTPTNTNTSPVLNDKQNAIAAYVKQKYWNGWALSDADVTALNTATQQWWLESVKSKISSLPQETQDLVRKAAQARLAANKWGQQNTNQNQNGLVQNAGPANNSWTPTIWWQLNTQVNTPNTNTQTNPPAKNAQWQDYVWTDSNWKPVYKDTSWIGNWQPPANTSTTQNTLNTQNNTNPNMFNGNQSMSWITKDRENQITANLTEWLKNSPQSFKDRTTFDAAYWYAWKSVAEKMMLDQFWNNQAQWSNWWQNAWNTTNTLNNWSTWAAWITNTQTNPASPTVNWTLDANWVLQWADFNQLAWKYASLWNMPIWDRLNALPNLIQSETDPTLKAQLIKQYQWDLWIQWQDVSQWHITWGWALTAEWQSNLIWSRMDPIALRMQSASNLLASNSPLIAAQQAWLDREQTLTLQQNEQKYGKDMAWIAFWFENALKDKDIDFQTKIAILNGKNALAQAQAKAVTDQAQIGLDWEKLKQDYWNAQWDRVIQANKVLQEDPAVKIYQNSYAWYNSIVKIIDDAKPWTPVFSDWNWSWIQDAQLIATTANTLDPSLNIADWTPMNWIMAILTQKQSPILNVLQQAWLNIDNLMKSKSNQLNESARQQLATQMDNNYRANASMAFEKLNNAKDSMLAYKVPKEAVDWAMRLPWQASNAKTSVSNAIDNAKKQSIIASPKTTTEEVWKIFNFTPDNHSAITKNSWKVTEANPYWLDLSWLENLPKQGNNLVPSTWSLNQ